MLVGQLSVVLGLAVSKNEWKEGEAYINHFRRVALAFGAIFGGRVLGKALIGFNENVENSKNQVASMLALGGQTTLASQLQNASDLYDMLRIKAAELPGQTQDYVDMLGMLAQPMARAKLDLKEMSDITAGAYVFSKGMGFSWQEASRDLRDFINTGKITARDQYLIGIMNGTGIEGTDAGRAKAKALGVRGRAMLVKKQTTGPLAVEVAERLGSSFEGRMETVKDNVKRIMGKMGESMFAGLKTSLTSLADWFKNNQKAIDIWAVKVGGYIASVFGAVRDAVMWLVGHRDILEAFFVAVGGALTFMAGRAIVAWMAVAWPVFAAAAIWYAFDKLGEYFGWLPTVLAAVGIAAGLMWLGVGGPIPIIIGLVMAVVSAILHAKEVISDFFSVSITKIPAIQKLLDEQNAGVSVGASTTPTQPERQFQYGDLMKQTSEPQNTVTVNSPMTVNLTAKDTESAIASFDKFRTSFMEDQLRSAGRHLQK